MGDVHAPQRGALGRQLLVERQGQLGGGASQPVHAHAGAGGQGEHPQQAAGGDGNAAEEEVNADEHLRMRTGVVSIGKAWQLRKSGHEMDT